MPQLDPRIEYRIYNRLKDLIYNNPELDILNPRPDWAARLVLHYWRTYQGLHFHVAIKSTRLTSPETLLRIARKYNLTPSKLDHFPLPEDEDARVEDYI